MRALFLAAFVLVAVPAFAQDTAIDLDGFFSSVRPYVLELFGLIIVAVVGYATKLLRDKTGIDIEAKHRDALQSALNNGANMILGKVLPDGKTGVKIEVGSATIADSVEYVLKSIPDAAKFFNLTPADVRRLLEPKILAMTAADPKVTAVGADKAVEVTKS